MIPWRRVEIIIFRNVYHTVDICGSSISCHPRLKTIINYPMKFFVDIDIPADMQFLAWLNEIGMDLQKSLKMNSSFEKRLRIFRFQLLTKKSLPSPGKSRSSKDSIFDHKYQIRIDHICDNKSNELMPVHRMRLVVHNCFQIHSFFSKIFRFSIIIQKNRMIQVSSCEGAFKVINFSQSRLLSHGSKTQ